MTTIKTGHVAPGFALKSVEGTKYSLDELLAHGPVVLGFFKISCPVCQLTFPFLQRIFERFAGSNASVIGVSQDEPRLTKEFNRQQGVTFPTLLDDNAYAVSNAYGLTSVPVVLLIAPDGEVKVSLVGFDKAGLEKIAGELAQYQNIASIPLFLPTESVPAHKPG